MTVVPTKHRWKCSRSVGSDLPDMCPENDPQNASQKRLDVPIEADLYRDLEMVMAEGGWTSKAAFVRDLIHSKVHGETAEDPVVRQLRAELAAVSEERDRYMAVVEQKTRALSQSTLENRTLRARDLTRAVDLEALAFTMDVMRFLAEGGTHTVQSILQATPEGWRVEGLGPWLEALFGSLSEAGFLVQMKEGYRWYQG